MPDDRNPKNDHSYQPGATTDSVRTMEDSIRRAFLTHMGEQQRQFATIAVRRAGVRDAEHEMGKKQVRQQQHTGNHEKPETEAQGSDQRGGTRAGAENVEPDRR